MGLCAGRSAGLVWGLLGILGSGAAYVPLDPAYPRARLAQALDDAGITRLVADAAGVAALGDLVEGREVIRLEDVAAEDNDGTPPAFVVPQPEQLAYVIYTSGSTGVPKGVGIPHGALASLLEAMDARLPIVPDDRWLSVTSVSFDIAALELFLPLIKGARVILAREHEVSNGAALAALIASREASVVQATPSGWKLLLAAGWRDGGASPPALRGLSGGEALPADLATALAERGVSLWNVYGPTETTIWSSAAPVTPALLEGVAHARLGTPLDGERLVVLGEDGLAVPAGGTGELCIGGVGLARGYLGRPGLTAERFVPDPSGAAGARLYRTGDLVRSDDHGIAYLGRLDHQVKLRGHRIELGEIEAALRAMPGVADAAVALHGPRLVGYVTGIAEPDDVRAKIAERLPAIMVPQVIVPLDTLPLTANGKLDRKKLAEPKVTATGAPPRNETEARVVAATTEVLGLPAEPFIDDSFFHLGGDSISAMRLVATLASALGRDVPIATVFEKPVLRDLAARIGDAPRAIVTARDAAATGPYPLSVEQERLWVLWRLDQASAAYTMFGAVRLDGVLDADRLRAALTSVVGRHESLRTRFVEVDGEGRQTILDEPAFDWTQREVAEASVTDAVSALVMAPFDLAAGPVLRAGLLRLSNEAHVLVLAMHHIVSDGWSIDILLRELSAFYEGIGGDLPPIAVHYADYALWQRAMYDAGRIETQLAYWHELLGDKNEPLRLPVDHRRGKLRSTHGGRVSATVPADVVADLRKLAQTSGTTLFVVLLAAWQALLHRYAGSADGEVAGNAINVGVPFAGRERPELRGTIGFFLSTLVLKAEIGVATTFADLVAQQTKRMAEARAHADVPFARIVDALGVQRSLADTPVFQTMFNLEQAADIAVPKGLVASGVATPVTTARYELALNVTEDKGAVRAALGFARDLFEPTTADALLDGWMRMLAHIAATPDVRIGAVELDTRGSHAVAGVAAFQAVQDRIAATVREKPDAIALCCGEARLTFVMLEARAAAIAGRLQATGVTTETRVGLCLARGSDLVAALLGVLKAGGAFVPLDPEHPAARLRDIVADAAPSLIIADHGTAALAAGLGAMPMLNIDEDAAAAAFVTRTLRPAQLAYVLYTSGSTGRPKGIGVSHAALSLHLDDFITTHSIHDHDVVLSSSTLGFDVALHEILPALIQGGRVVMRGRAPWSFESLTSTLTNERVTFARIPTAFWQHWIRAGVPALPALRQITVGGEGLPGDTLAQWFASPLATTPLDNLYGPTETTVAALRHVVTPADSTSTFVSIGRPYPGRSARVLDLAGDVVPAGGYGELCIGGESLARGYVGRPSLTAERFVPDPEGAPGSRLYRTGDLCRPCADGAISFLGRLDRQVKLRGQRIELGEIEAALRAQPGVSDAAVEMRGTAESARLVGYVVGEVADAALAARLSTRLPAHMIPTAFVHLAALPVTATGKLDRAALPEPALRRAEARRVPTTPEEVTLCRIVAELLTVPAPGPDDNFFAIGGDSLSALRLVAACTEAGLAHVTLTGVFAAATLSALVAQRALPRHLQLLNAPAPSCAFCFHPSFGLTAEYAPLAHALRGRTALYGLDSPFLDEEVPDIGDFAGLAAHHVAQIRSIQPHGPYRLIGWSLGGWLALEAARQLEDAGEAIAFLALVDTLAVAAPDAAVQDPSSCEGPASDAATLEAIRQVGGTHLIPASIRQAETTVLRQTLAAFRHHNRLLQGYRLPKIASEPSIWWSAETVTRWPDLVDWSRLVPRVRDVTTIEGSTHLDVVRHPHVIAEIADAVIAAPR